jgi:hypothetical protein
MLLPSVMVSALAWWNRHVVTGKNADANQGLPALPSRAYDGSLKLL